MKSRTKRLIKCASKYFVKSLKFADAGEILISKYFLREGRYLFDYAILHMKHDIRANEINDV